jgi:proliferating cell nuclear antigen
MTSITNNDDDYVFIIKTVQSAPFRTLIESLKDIAVDCNLEIDSTGIKIQTLNPSHKVLVHVKLDAEPFDKFFCRRPTLVGISMITFFKLIRTMTPSDTLTLFMEEDETNKLGILIENGEKNQKTAFKLLKMDIKEEKYEIQSSDFDSHLTWVSSDFAKTCRDMAGLGIQNVDIRSTNGQLILSGMADTIYQETVIGDSGGEGSMSIVKNDDPEEIIQGRFQLKYLVMFTKCTNLCNNVELYFKNEFPLIIRYKVSNLGEVKFCIANEEDDGDK